MIYIILYTMLVPGSAAGQVSGLWEDCYTDLARAEREFKEKVLTPIYIRKELWVKEPGGRRTMMKYETYHSTDSVA